MFAFVVGFERCGTHSAANIIKAGCTVSGFVVHEDKPQLFKEAYDAFCGRDYRSPQFQDRLEKYNWLSSRLKLVCEANHRLGYFVSDLRKLADSKFILLVRDPVDTLVSRVATLQHWPEILYRYPEFYQKAASTKVHKGSELANLYRIKPTDMTMPLHEIYLHEWIENYRFTLNDLREANKVLVLRTETLSMQFNKIFDFIEPSWFNKAAAAKAAAVRTDSVFEMIDKSEEMAFAKDLILPKADEIRNRIRDAFPSDKVIQKLTEAKL